MRQASSGAAVAAATSGTGLGITANDTDRTNNDADGDESFCSDEAQQLSASAWLTARLEVESGESDLCIGHAPPSEQQAMRASGVASQPAQSPTWLLHVSARVTRSAERRLVTIGT